VTSAFTHTVNGFDRGVAQFRNPAVVVCVRAAYVFREVDKVIGVHDVE
jgi:hypothetical protein